SGANPLRSRKPERSRQWVRGSVVLGAEDDLVPGRHAGAPVAAGAPARSRRGLLLGLESRLLPGRAEHLGVLRCLLGVRGGGVRGRRVVPEHRLLHVLTGLLLGAAGPHPAVGAELVQQGGGGLVLVGTVGGTGARLA